MNNQTEAEKIKAALRQTRGTREYARVVAVNMVRVNGQSPIFAAKMLGVDRGTVSLPDSMARAVDSRMSREVSSMWSGGCAPSSCRSRCPVMVRAP